MSYTILRYFSQARGYTLRFGRRSRFSEGVINPSETWFRAASRYMVFLEMEFDGYGTTHLKLSRRIREYGGPA